MIRMISCSEELEALREQERLMKEIAEREELIEKAKNYPKL